MNDLDYSTWMKFQKSFFWYVDDAALIHEWVSFFTKAVWEDGTPSRSLVICPNMESIKIPSPREIIYGSAEGSLDLVTFLEALQESSETFDFIIINLLDLVNTRENASAFIKQYSGRMFASIQHMLAQGRYASVLVPFENSHGQDFPMAWTVSEIGRGHLRLRDEKIALVKDTGNVFYCLQFQGDTDDRVPTKPQPCKSRTVDINPPTWVIPKSPPRKRNEILHPAKFPETLIETFIDLFTNPGDTVMDPMVGTGSAVLAAVRRGRNGIGIELSPEFAAIASERIGTDPLWADYAQASLFPDRDFPGMTSNPPLWAIVTGNAMDIGTMDEFKDVKADYLITSPPYWSMLQNKGSENQRNRRNKNLPLVYSDNPADLGNVEDYDEFINLLSGVYNDYVATKLKRGGYATIIVKNVKRNHTIYPLAWDLTRSLCGPLGNFAYIGTTFWCQDDIGMKPFAVGIHWVSNIVHHYCLHFQKI